MKVLISDTDQEYINKIKPFLERNSLEVKICPTGKDCQLEVYKGGVSCLLLNIDIENNPGLAVMKYMRLNHPTVKLVLVINSKKRLAELELSQDDLKKFAASSILIKPFSDDILLKTVKGESYDGWKELKPNEEIPPEEEKVLLLKDEEFTRVSLESVQSGNLTIFDHFIRLGQGRFVKVLRKGDYFDRSRVEKYINEGKVQYLYFKTKDRTTYINYMNDILQKLVSIEKKPISKVVTSMRTVSEMFINEIYTVGLKPLLVDEGIKICENMAKLARTDATIAKYVREMQDIHSDGNAHLFLTSFFSTIICKNLPWAGIKTVETVAMGGLLHDIGKLRLPVSLRDKEESQVPKNQIELFKQHPLFGVEMLNKSPLITDQVKQIVYQHHELVNGTGYPNGLSGTNIYPLAKIVSLADYFTLLITSEGLTPLEGLKKFIPRKEETIKFDPEIIRALVMSLTR